MLGQVSKIEKVYKSIQKLKGQNSCVKMIFSKFRDKKRTFQSLRTKTKFLKGRNSCVKMIFSKFRDKKRTFQSLRTKTKLHAKFRNKNNI